jgi:hypothetical protein
MLAERARVCAVAGSFGEFPDPSPEEFREYVIRSLPQRRGPDVGRVR